MWQNKSSIQRTGDALKRSLPGLYSDRSEKWKSSDYEIGTFNLFVKVVQWRIYLSSRKERTVSLLATSLNFGSSFFFFPLGSMVILTNINSSNPRTNGYLSISLSHLQFLLSMFNSFQNIGLLPPCLSLFQKKKKSLFLGIFNAILFYFFKFF